MKRKFKPGDKVRCVKGMKGRLNKGTVYTISSVEFDVALGGYFVCVDEKPGNTWWSPGRFEFVETGDNDEA